MDLQVLEGKETHKRSKNSKIQDVFQKEPEESNENTDRKKVKGGKSKRTSPTKRMKNPSDLTRDIEEAAKDKSQEEKSVSDLIDSGSQNKSPVEESKAPKSSDKKPRENSPSNDTSLHKVNADEKSSKDEDINPTEAPLETTKRDPTPVSKTPADENAETLKKAAKSRRSENPKEETKHHISEKDNGEVVKGVIYVKQTIESYRDSQLSMKLDEREVQYTMNIDGVRTENTKLPTRKNSLSDKKSNQQSFQPMDNSSRGKNGTSLNESPSKPSNIFEVDLDTSSKKSDKSKKSAAISIMREDDLQSRKSAAIKCYA